MNKRGAVKRLGMFTITDRGLNRFVRLPMRTLS
jgi:hypothetical protein